ncbi:MAG: SH3 domain-containing protein [Thermomicrobiales bacterium]
MSTAFNRPSMWKRVGALALAGTIALGTLMPGNGLVSADSGATVTPTPSSTFDVPAGSGLAGLTAVVVGGGTDLFADPAADSTVLAHLDEGTVVDLRIDEADTVTDASGVRWWPVAVSGQDGWIAGNFLADASAITPTATATSAVTPTGTVSGGSADAEFDYTGEIVAGIQAMVAGDGSAVNMRSAATASSDIVAEVPDGATVTLRIDTTDTVTDVNGTRWWPVNYAGKDGWIAGAYLRAIVTPTPTVTTTVSPTAPATSGETEFVAGAYVRVKTDDGTGAVLRSEPIPTGGQVASWQEGQVAQIISGPLSYAGSTRGWFKVSNGAVTGYIDGDLLVLAGAAPTTGTTTPTSESTGVFAPGDSAMVQTERGTGANLRTSGDPGAESISVVPEGATVAIVSGPSSFTESTNGWFEVSYNGQTGFVDGDLLVKLASATVTPTTVPVTPDTTVVAGQTGEDGSLRKGDTVTVASGSGGVNVRQSPADDSSIAGYLNDGVTATIIDGPIKDEANAYWYKVSNGSDVQGWVAGRLITTGGSAPAPTQAPVTVAPTEAATTPAETVPPAPTTTAPPTAAPTATTGPAVSAQGFIIPLDSYTVTQEFGCSYLGFYTYDPAMGCPVHDGIDLAAPEGTPIHAAKAGTVVAAGWCDCGLGYYVEIDHGNGVHTLYGHMQSQPWVTVGQQVAQGEEIGPLGSTGLSTGPHTHFMVTVDGVAQNPRNFLPPT